MSSTQAGHVLDNPIWYALNSHHAHIAIGTEWVKRYPSDVSVACALANHSDAAFKNLEEFIAPDDTILLIEANPPDDLAGWTIERTARLDQLVCEAPLPQPKTDLDVVELNPADVPDMFALIASAPHPAPFFPRTVEIGRYVGIRQQGQLVAMGGERYHLTGYCELSGIYTHPDWQGRGYARLLTTILTNGIWDRGETPFLHVYPDNASAYHLYETMHYHKRCNMVGHYMSHQ